MYVVTPFSPCFDDHQILPKKIFRTAFWFIKSGIPQNFCEAIPRGHFFFVFPKCGGWPWPCEMGRKFQRLFFVQNPAPWKKQLIHVHQHVYIYIYIDLLLIFSCLLEVIHFSIKVPSCRDPQLVPRSWRIATAASPSWAESSERRSVGTFSADGSDRSNDRSAFVGRVNSRWAETSRSL